MSVDEPKDGTKMRLKKKKDYSTFPLDNIRSYSHKLKLKDFSL